MLSRLTIRRRARIVAACGIALVAGLTIAILYALGTGQRQLEAIQHFRGIGGQVQFENRLGLIHAASRLMLGSEAGAYVTELNLIGPHVTNDDLQYLQGLPDLDVVDLQKTSVTVPSLERIAALPRLRVLNVV